MKAHSLRHGFTIIEVLLFISISSLLAILLLGGWTVAVNTQSYKDSLTSLSSTLQQQYTAARDVMNDRSARYQCAQVNGSVKVTRERDGGVSRGTSDCIIMGRYIYADGPHFTIYPIIGLEPSDPIVGVQTEDAAITSYSPIRLSETVIPAETYDIPWSSRPYTPQSTDKLRFAMAIMRSPASGTIITYVEQLSPDGSDIPTPRSVMNNALDDKLTICLDPGAPVAMGRTAIVINHAASSQAGIDQLGDGEANGC